MFRDEVDCAVGERVAAETNGFLAPGVYGTATTAKRST